MMLGSSAHDVIPDDAARRKLRRAIHYLFNSQAILPGRHTWWPGIARGSHLWDWRHRRLSHRLHYDAT